MDGRAVSNATVTILGHSGSARTDHNGRFRWNPLPWLPFEVLVVLSNGQYSAPVLIREIPADGIIRVQVEPVAEDEIFVTSGVTPNIEVPNANGKTTLSAAELEIERPARVVEALTSLPGVSSISEGQAAVPTIRGLGRGRTLVLIDGGRVTTERRAGPSATFVDPFMLEGVEVARGPGSVAYGSDAFGGVIHMRTRKPRLGEDLDVKLAAGAGFGVPDQTGRVQAAQGFQNWAYLLSGSVREFQNYRSPAGEITNSGAKSRHIGFSTVHGLAEGLLTLGWQTDLGRDIGRPRNDSLSNRFYYPEEESYRFTATYEFPPFAELSRFKMDFFVGQYRLVTTRDQPPQGDAGRTISRSDVDASDFGFRVLGIKPLRRARLEFGVDVNGRFGLEALGTEQIFDTSEQLLRSSTETAIENASRFDAALFSSAEVSLSRAVTIAGGVRFDQISTNNQGGTFGDLSTSDSAFSGYGSASLTLRSGFSLTGQVSRGFRDPTLSDRYFQGLSGRGLITGNPLLEPETSLQYDLAARYGHKPVGIAVYLYRYQLSDLIERFETEPDMFFFRNRGEALIRGVEVESHFVLTGGWSLKAGVQWVQGEAEEGDALADIPPRSVGLQVSKLISERAQIQLRSTLFDRDDRPGPTEVTTPGHARFDLLGRVRLNRVVSVVGEIRNLLDKDYPASPDSRSTLAPGRSGGFTILFDF